MAGISLAGLQNRSNLSQLSAFREHQKPHTLRAWGIDKRRTGAELPDETERPRPHELAGLQNAATSTTPSISLSASEANSSESCSSQVSDTHLLGILQPTPAPLDESHGDCCGDNSTTPRIVGSEPGGNPPGPATLDQTDSREVDSPRLVHSSPSSDL